MLAGVEKPSDGDEVIVNTIDENIIGMGDNFPRSKNTAGASYERMRRQHFR